MVDQRPPDGTRPNAALRALFAGYLSQTSLQRKRSRSRSRRRRRRSSSSTNQPSSSTIQATVCFNQRPRNTCARTRCTLWVAILAVSCPSRIDPSQRSIVAARLRLEGCTKCLASSASRSLPPRFTILSTYKNAGSPVRGVRSKVKSIVTALAHV